MRSRLGVKVSEAALASALVAAPMAATNPVAASQSIHQSVHSLKRGTATRHRLRITHTEVSCSAPSFMVNSQASCSATVSGSNLKGKLYLTDGGSNSFNFSKCSYTLSSFTCQFSYSNAAPGSYTIKAMYTGDQRDGASVGTFQIAVNPLQTNTSVSCSQASVAANSSVTCTATTVGTALDDNAIVFSDNSNGTFTGFGCTLNPNTEACTVQYSNSNPGSYTITARYNASNPSTSSGSTILNVVPPTSVNSYNYVGYEAYSSLINPQPAITGASASWVIEPISVDQAGEVSQWVGIGGAAKGDNTLIQAGTMWLQRAEYVWYELLPNYPILVNMSVSVGDRINVSIVETGQNLWQINIANTTNGQTFGIDVQYDSSMLSASFVKERPVFCPDGIVQTCADVPPVNFGTAGFDQPEVTVNGSTVPLSGAPNQRVYMVSNNGSTVIATPSALSADGSFTMSYDGQ